MKALSGDHGIIKIRKDGFWKVRSSPGKSLRKAAKIFNIIKGETIIEVGSGLHGKMSGNSILVWVNNTNAKKIIAIDLDKNSIDAVKKATADSNKVEAILFDGIEYIKNYQGKIDLLYLDFWSPDKKGTILGTGRAEDYLKIYNVARHKMNKNSIILIDDTDHIHPWKHTFIVPEARKDRYTVIWKGRQTLLLRNNDNQVL